MNSYSNMGSVSISAAHPSTAELSSVACALHSRQNGVCTSLCICRCILHALKVLHQAGFAHTDLRWENIILQHAGQWVLIDLEFACELDCVPFTPMGKPMSCVLVCGLYCLSACLQIIQKASKQGVQDVSSTSCVQSTITKHLCSEC